MNTPKWIRFREMPTPAVRKTRVWDVESIDSGASLGRISWWGRWRKYSFFPHANMVFEPTCLRDIAAFIDEQMEARKGKGAA